MPIWRTKSITQEPELVITNWSIRELWDGTRHIVGWSPLSKEGRVSSRIVEFDPEKLLGKTKSGRIYKLKGDPGFNLDAEYVWNRWRDNYGIKEDDWKFVEFKSEELSKDFKEILNEEVQTRH